MLGNNLKKARSSTVKNIYSPKTPDVNKLDVNKMPEIVRIDFYGNDENYADFETDKEEPNK